MAKVTISEALAGRTTVTTPGANAAVQVTYLGADHVFVTSNGISVDLWGAFQPPGPAGLFGTVQTVDLSYRGIAYARYTDLNLPVSQVVWTLGSFDGRIVEDLLVSRHDEVYGSTRGDFAWGGAGNDTILGLDGADTVYGDIGADDLNGNVGADIVHGGDGADWVRGGRDNDTISGDNGDDPHVNGNLGDDFVSGGDGNDTIYGGQGNDTLNGDFGDDSLSGDLGDDVMTGWRGADRFALRAGGGHDHVVDFNPSEGDRIVIAPGETYSVYTWNLGWTGVRVGEATLALDGFVGFSPDWVVYG